MHSIEMSVLERFKELLIQRVSVIQVIVFGSRARGDADRDSDLDVVVVLADSCHDADRDYVSDCAWEASFASGMVIMPVVFTQHEWEVGPERHSLLAQAVRAEGVPI
jgi:DNA polymerase sigma